MISVLQGRPKDQRAYLTEWWNQDKQGSCQNSSSAFFSSLISHLTPLSLLLQEYLVLWQKGCVCSICCQQGPGCSWACNLSLSGWPGERVLLLCGSHLCEVLDSAEDTLSLCQALQWPLLLYTRVKMTSPLVFQKWPLLPFMKWDCISEQVLGSKSLCFFFFKILTGGYIYHWF